MRYKLSFSYSSKEYISLIPRRHDSKILQDQDKTMMAAYTREINLYELAIDAVNPPAAKISCVNLQRFATWLLKVKGVTGVIPVTGINIIRWYGHLLPCVKSSNDGELDEIYENILDQMKCKRLKIEFIDDWHNYPSCQTVLFAKKLLDKFSDSLEELSIYIPDEPQLLLQHRSFQQLKLLKYKCATDNYWTTNSLIPTLRMLVSRAPSLQILFTSGSLDLSGNVLEGSSAVHFTDHPYSTSMGEIPESVVGALRLHRMKLTDIHEDFELEQFNRVTFNVLEASRTTLNWMHMDVLFLLPLATYGIRLENVTTLEVHLPKWEAIQWFGTVLKRCATFDFSEIFPNLGTVTVEHDNNKYHRLGHLLGILDQENFDLHNPRPANRAQNIKKLSLRWGSTSNALKDRCMEFLAKLFPDIMSLSILAGEVPFASIWKCWPHLEELDVTFRGPFSYGVTNLDADFCGICEEEAVKLRERDDDEYLRNVKIDSVKPSVTMMKSLRTLKIYQPVWAVQTETGPVCFLSKVTGLIAFQRCPNLTVNLEVGSEITEQDMSDIKPFVNVSYV